MNTQPTTTYDTTNRTIVITPPATIIHIEELLSQKQDLTAQLASVQGQIDAYNAAATAAGSATV